VSPRAAALGAIGLGGIAVAAATLAGTDAAVLDAIVHPPPIVRAALVGVAAALAVVLLSGGLSRLAAGTTDVPALIRGVRLVFLAIAAAAAGAGWALGDALPLVVALVIAGIDVLETSFLLLVVAGGQVNRRR
jgi:Na+-transporting NADH:ubiquinone oxidoreductase subunit NqrE